MRAVLIGDIHHYHIYRLPWQWVGKHFFGLTNAATNRTRRFDRKLIPHMVDRVMELAPDWVFLSGDLTTTATNEEVNEIAKMLKPLFENFKVAAIPGNHDRYTKRGTKQKRFEKALNKYGDITPEAYPKLTYLGDNWNLLMLDAAFPQFVQARGYLGPQQIEAAEALLDELPTDARLCVMCHYPIHILPKGMHEPGFHALADAGAVRSMLARRANRHSEDNPILYMHGHIHRPWFLIGPDMDNLSHVWDINAGAPVLVNSSYPQGQGFWEIELHAKGMAPNLIHHYPHPEKGTLPDKVLVKTEERALAGMDLDEVKTANAAIQSETVVTPNGTHAQPQTQPQTQPLAWRQKQRKPINQS